MSRFLVLALAGACLVQPARAQDSPAMRKACQQDYERLCPGVMPGGGRIAACFKDKRDQLSDGCRAALQQAAVKRRTN